LIIEQLQRFAAVLYITIEMRIELRATYLAFYSGWPSAVSAVSVAKEALPPK
jgi:alkylhydroperoxidase/carboxymuconolactone decarboxylase family protein YurZ